MKRAVLLLLTSCFDFTADLNTCLKTGTCACPYGQTAPAPKACGNDRDLYVAPTGDNANSGTTSSAPLKSLDTVTLLPGDRAHFTGTFTQGLYIAASGTADCPITLDGDATFHTDQNNGVRLAGSFLRLSGLHFEEDGAQANGGGLSVIPNTPDDRSTDVLLENLTLHAVSDLATLIYIQQCTRCTVSGSTFTATGLVDNAIQTWASDESRLLNSTVSGRIYSKAFDLRDTQSLVSGNMFSGCAAAKYENSDTATGNLFTRNIVHDVGDGLMVQGANAVVHNTFVNLGSGAAADMGVFRGNIVSIAAIGLDAGAPGTGGYNLFNSSAAYASGAAGTSDLRALPKLDATTYAPLAGSPAIDAADPNDPVPAGGGLRADIGAIELGAIHLPGDGYCEPFDAGF